MDEVARRARVGRATLYKHFPRRDALIGAVVQTELASSSPRSNPLSSDTMTRTRVSFMASPTPIDCSVTTRPSAQFSDSTLRSSCRT